MCDNTSIAYQFTIRKARKAHRCLECNGRIAAGNHYEFISGIWPDQGPDSFKTCVMCAVVREAMNDGAPCEDQICHGELADAMAHYA